ncbi:MAG: hypothetical protein A3F74_14410 [Betaproteobacteria bacterium RIFCSPLOWO2_12_FULL_62_58]|nr:MAG: hypothetical protein A3F74_14410 [Betaproteobacteria bacterium RIFCSPLOWO2_12_FULL_62_58]
MPDDEWFGVFWVDAKALAAAFNMDGAFNSVLLRLAHGASAQTALDALDRMVEDGLRPGERVVVYPSDALRDGSRIRSR